ncbi:hypothetical protein LJD47_27985, partial [Escherichia coli]|nr:hypothetical protein [Escherichia coli]
VPSRTVVFSKAGRWALAIHNRILHGRSAVLRPLAMADAPPTFVRRMDVQFMLLCQYKNLRA